MPRDPYLATAVQLGLLPADKADVIEEQFSRARLGGASDVRSWLVDNGVVPAHDDAAILSALAGRMDTPRDTVPQPQARQQALPQAGMQQPQQRAHAGEQVTLLADDDDGAVSLTLMPGESVGETIGADPRVSLPQPETPESDPDSETAASATRAPSPKYTLGDVLGRGGNAEVLRAYDRDLRRDVAIKVLHRADTPKLRMRFIEEAQVTGQLEHPNIVPIHELAVDEKGRPFIVMKRVKGRSLTFVIDAVRYGDVEAARLGSAPRTVSGSDNPNRTKLATPAGGIKRPRGVSRDPSHAAIPTLSTSRARRSTSKLAQRAPESVDVARPSLIGDEPVQTRARLLNVFLKICDAIEYAHSRRVIHRDLKPDNVMVGEFGDVLVMDWGIAKALTASRTTSMTGDDDVISTIRDEHAAMQTMDGQIAGTPSYMPPEQAKGQIDRLDERSDIYSLGAILYEILACVPPFDCDNVFETLAAVSQGKLQPPSARSAAPWSIPRELETVVIKAMALRPSQRYQTVCELRRDIERFLAGHTLGAVDYSPMQVLAKWAARHKAAVIGATATALTFVGALVSIGVLIARADVERMQEVERARVDQAAVAESVQREIAERLHDEGERAWTEAGTVRLNPAAPAEYFQSHLRALMRLGRALQAHPGAPPAEWSAAVAARTHDLQNEAQRVGDWAIASVLVESPEAWGAIDAGEAAARRARLDAALAQRAEDDRRRIDHLLDRIAEAEGRSTDSGEAGDARQLREHRRALLPGELRERARLVARQSGAGITRVLVARLKDEIATPLGSVSRRALIEVLAIAGDPLADVHGTTAPALIAHALDRDANPMLADETNAWIWAAVKFEARWPAAFQPWGGFDAVLQPAREAYAQHPAVAQTASAAVDYLLQARNPAPLPSPDDEPEAYAIQVDQIGELIASKIKSGTAYTQHLLALSGDDDLSQTQRRVVLDQLGMHGDTLPPNPDTPTRSAPAVLRETFRAMPVEWAVDLRPARVSFPKWTRARLDAICAATNLARLQIASFTPELHAARRAKLTAGEFARRTELPFMLLPMQWKVESIADLIARGAAHTQRWELAEAAADLELALIRDSNNPDALFERAVLRLRSGQFRAAVDDLTVLIERDQRTHEARLHRGGAYRALGEFEPALWDFDEAIRLDPSDTAGYNMFGLVLMQLGEYEKAIQAITAAIMLRPGNSGLYYNRGLAYAKLRNWDKAIRDYSKTLEFDPNNAEVYSDRGIAMRALGRVEAAIEDFNRAIALNPLDAHPYANRGNMLSQLGDYEGALADHTMAIALAPGIALNYSNRASVLILQRRFADAITDCDTAIRLDSAEGRAWYNRGIASGLSGNATQAVADLTMALQIGGDAFVEAYLYRAQAQAQLGAFSDALTDANSYIKRVPDDFNGWATQAVLQAFAGMSNDSRESFARALDLAPDEAKPAIEAERRRLLGE